MKHTKLPQGNPGSAGKDLHPIWLFIALTIICAIVGMLQDSVTL